ncbi:protein DpdJ [Methylobacterium sp. CM6244]
MTRDWFVAEFLSFLERREARLLGWGFFDIAFDVADVETLLEDEGPDSLVAGWCELRAASGMSMAGLLDDMAQEGLLYVLPEDVERFRTRFAEGVRLTARLRQLFRPGDWPTAPRLVSDVKLHLAPRRYPKRDQSIAVCWGDLAAGATSAALQSSLFDALGRDSAGRHYGGFAGFQRRAFVRILERYGRDGVTGAVVSAGTGSGKTKAVYVPAYLGIAADIERDPTPFTKIIAVYPRNVLLGDQLREAVAEAAKVAPVLAARGLRPISFGALTGDTPPAGAFGQTGSLFLRNWERQGNAWRLPLLKSPRDGTVDLLWRDDDRAAGVTSLRAANDPHGGAHVADGVMRLTRDAICSHPPDVLMLSIEMLHRELGNPAYGGALGTSVDPARTPRLLLLDEIHTYEGLAGAQIPWVLRRWRAAVRPRALQVLGLSATLHDARGHLAAVASLAAAHVEEFRPEEHSNPQLSEFEIEGQEYNLAVKGNAASGTSLLTTSIQCGMLLSRLLTPRHLALGSGGTGSTLYARKVFGFTDSLDGLNRWYADLSDAENNKHLARLRLPDPAAQANPAVRAAERLRRDEGQIWDMPVALGHNLVRDARVDRCSSQDAGVNAGADIVLATSSLEVGYDDPEVGVVLHHKTPRSNASFIQRKGRAGRRRGTRPATVVVLSDYGADRWSFQNSERLFEPTLDRIALPVLNPHVMRVQATAFLLDWLGRRVGRREPFTYLRRRSSDLTAQARARALLNEILDGGPAFDRFRADLLSLARPMIAAVGPADRVEAVVDGVLWDEPRPVLRHAVPALLRKLEAEWTFAEPGRQGMEDEGKTRPVPDYLPSASFAPLDGIEVVLRFPDHPNKDEETMSAARALFETCPCRVSKRFSVRKTELGYWLVASVNAVLAPRAAGGGEDVVEAVAALYPESVLVGIVDGVPIYQPLAVDLRERPVEVSDSSNARWEWHSRLEQLGAGSSLPVFLDPSFSGALGPVTAHLHREGGGLRVLRWASSARFDITFRDGRACRGRLRLEDPGTSNAGGTAEAVGFEQTVDGIRIGLTPERLQAVPPLDGDATARLRPEFFLDILQDDDLIANRAGPFMAGWLWQTSLAMLAATAVVQRCSLHEAQRRLHNRRPQAAARVLDRIFGGLPADDDDEAGGFAAAPAGAPAKARQRDRLLSLWSDPQVLARVEAAEVVLWQDPPQPSFDAWLGRRHLATVAQAVRAAALSLVPEIAEDDLVVDLATEPVVVGTGDAGAFETAILLTETGPGGLGQIEAIVARMRAEPEAFEDAFRHALDHCPRETTAATLLHTLEAARRPRGGLHPTAIATALGEVRRARGHAEAEDARTALTAALDHEGVEPTRNALVAIAGRLARPGSGKSTDAFAHGLNRAWRRHERALGTSIDPRVFAYLCLENRGLRRRLARFLRDLAGTTPVDHQLYAAARDMLLPGCEDSCPECLDGGHPFGGLARPSRDLTRRWLGLSVARVDVDAGFAWLERVRVLLRSEGRVLVQATRPLGAHAGRGLQMLLAEEVEREFVMAPVSLASVARTSEGWAILLRLRAAGHV